MDYTYGEELPLDVVAPLFASAARASSSNLPQPAGSSQPASRSTSKISTQVKDMQDEEEEEDDLEEGELLEDGEISEETSDEAEFIAASLIATAPSAKQAKARDTLHTLPQDWIHRLEPQSTSTTALSETGCRLPEVFHPSKTGSSAATHQTLPASSATYGLSSSPTLAEFESLIDELYTYGVTCDYLIGKGVTKDRVIATFAKRGYKLPQNHLDRYKEQQQQWKDHQATLIQQQPLASTSTTYPSHLNQHSNGYEETNMPAGKRASSPVVTDHSMSLPGPSTSKPTLNKSHHRATSSLTDPSLIRLGTLIPTPPTSAPPPTTKRRRESQDTTESLHPTSHTPAPPSTIPSSSAAVKDPSAELKLLKEELVRKEAAAKEALKARRAALAKQNAQRAESFIEGLLSESKASIQSVPSSAGMQSTQTLPAEVVRDSTTLASTSKASSTVADDLEDYEDTDHSQVAASGAPVASSSTSLPLSTTRPEVLRRGSSNTFTTQVTRQQRAVATDFEGDPSHKLSGVPRWTEQLLESSRRDTAHTDMLIDLSDSDSEDDSDYDEADGQQKSEDDKEQLRLAVEKSRLQDSLNHNNYYQVSSLSSTSSSIPYPSYSLNNVTKISESARSSPAPSPATIPLVKKKPSPPSSIRSKASTPSFPSRLVNPTATPAIQSTSISTAGKAELEAKQAEIRKMLEMIKKLEGKKKQKKHTTEGSDSFSTNITAGKDDSALMAVERDRVGERIATERIADTQHQEKIDAAKETVGRLLDEQDQLVTSSELARSEIDDKVGAGSSSGIELSSSNSTTSSSVTPSNLAMRESSSDEAMSISSEGE